ncbi:MAG: hypothetical protein WKF30_10615 [Pyrinomonadaceae bacterium]
MTQAPGRAGARLGGRAASGGERGAAPAPLLAQRAIDFRARRKREPVWSYACRQTPATVDADTAIDGSAVAIAAYFARGNSFGGREIG